jgi:hypothetical protein
MDRGKALDGSEGRGEVLKLAAAAAQGPADAAAGAAAFQAPRPGQPSGPTAQIDVVSYGAGPCGRGDWTAAIRRAIDDAARAKGGTVLFPTGTHSCNRPLTADRSVGVRLLGMGTETVSAEPVATLRYEGDAREPGVAVVGKGAPGSSSRAAVQALDARLRRLESAS